MPTSTSNEVRAHIVKVFGKELQIVEATTPLRVQPIPDDLVGASPKDPSNCVLVHTIKRMYSSPMVLVFKGVSYVALPGPDGKLRIERFMISTQATKQLSDFDRGKAFPIGTTVMFVPPPKPQTLKRNRKRTKAKAAADKKWVDRRKQLTAALAKKRRAAELAADRLRKAKETANIKQSDKLIAAAKQRKAAADAALKDTANKIAAMDKNRKKRAPQRFDLTTRNGALGNYNFTDPIPLAVLTPEQAAAQTKTLIP